MLGRPVRRPTAQSRFIATGMKLFALRRKLDAALERHDMATVIWGGDRFTATPVSQNADGSWVMEAQQRTARTVPGTRITVQPREIVSGMPATIDDLPDGSISVNLNDAPKTDVAVAATQVAAPKGKSMTSRLSEKASLVANGQKSLMLKAEGHFDAMLEAQKNSAERLNAAMQKIKDNQADIDAGTATIEDLANQLTNG